MAIELGRTTGKINLTNSTGSIELSASADNVELTNSADNIELSGTADEIELVIKGSGSSVEIDNTLSKEGAAADAAATGEALGELKAAQPDWLVEDTSSHSFINNKPIGTTVVKYLSCDYKSDFVVGTNLLMEINKSYTRYFTYDAFTNHRGFTIPSIKFKALMMGQEIELIVATFDKYGSDNVFKVVNTVQKITIYVITNRDVLSDADKAKFPVFGVYIDFPTQAAIDSNSVVAAKVETLQYTKLDKKYLPIDIPYISELPEPGGSAVEVDTTLSIEGAAADAKATGDAINEVKEKTELLMEDYIGAFPISTHPNSTYNTKYNYVNALTVPEGKYAINKHTKTVILGATADDGTVKTITMYPIDNTVIEVSTNNAYVFISSDSWDYRWRIALADTSTSSKIVVDRILNLYLGINNIVEYTPTQNYHPATKKYVDDSIKVDTTLSKEGTAADAKATGDAIVSLGDNTLSTKYYSIDIVKMKNNGVAHANTILNSQSSSNYTLTVVALFYPVIFENGVKHKLIDAPFEFIYVNQPIWMNAHQFKRIGITSPVIAQQLGVNEILWFDTTIPKILSAFDMNEGSYELKYGDASDYHPEAQIAVQFTSKTTNGTAVYQVKGLWDLIFSNQDTKLIFEYENQENIEIIDAPFSLEAAPIVNA